MSQNPQSDSRPSDLKYLRDPIVFACSALVLLGGAFFVIWASTAQLAQGITANGILIVEDRRRSLQHFEGGIIQSLNIREGDTVNAGDLAMVVSDAASAAQLSKIRAEQRRLLATLDRLDAHVRDMAEPTFTGLLSLPNQSAETERLIALSRQLFFDRKAVHQGRKSVINSQIERIQAEARALETRRIGKRREIAAIGDEQAVQQSALSQQLGNISRVNEVARQMAIAETELANLDEEEQVIGRGIDEARLELAQVELDFRAELSDGLSEASTQLILVEDELTALTDQQQRRNVVVPVDGVVIDLAFTAEGGVVAPGERLFDIVPSGASVQVEVRFQPKDRDDLIQGRTVNLRFGSLNPIRPPEIAGQLSTIAADATLDQQSGAYFYLAKVDIAPDALSELDQFEISPGIPVEVFFDTGNPRTPLSYFIEPITEMLRLGMRS